MKQNEIYTENDIGRDFRNRGKDSKDSKFWNDLSIPSIDAIFPQHKSPIYLRYGTRPFLSWGFPSAYAHVKIPRRSRIHGVGWLSTLQDLTLPIAIASSKFLKAESWQAEYRLTLQFSFYYFYTVSSHFIFTFIFKPGKSYHQLRYISIN